jgi:hypothetical protein
MMLSLDDGAFMTREPTEAAECRHCGAYTCWLYVWIGIAATTVLGACCTLLCAERRARHLGLGERGER